MANLPTVTARVLFLAGLLLAATQCNNSECESLRDDLTREKLEWQRCARDEDCIIVGGNLKDCTGVLACNFAVNRDRRIEAERRVVSLPEDTVDCMQCSPPNCVDGELAICEPVTQRCIVVTDLVEPTPPPEGGT
jgi:hypothetical protein